MKTFLLKIWTRVAVGFITVVGLLFLPQPALSQPVAFIKACNVAPLPLTGTRIVNVSTEPALQAAVANARAGDTIVIANGTYNLTRTLLVNDRNNVTLRGTSGCDGVVLVGKGMDNPNFGSVEVGIWSNSLHTTIAHLTIQDTYDNLLLFNSGAQSPRIYSVKLLNSGSQFIKSNPTNAANGVGVDNGVVEYSWFEYLTTPPSTDHGVGVGYFNGISAHAADGWVVRGNYFKNLHNPDSPTSYWWNPTVLFWNHSSNTLTENNIFLNVDRAIAYGLTDQSSGTDHSGGTIRNNFITETPGLMSPSRKAASDGLIIVNDSPNTKVYHNTIVTNGNIRYAIEFRFAATTNGEARNNLADAPVNLRAGATATQSGNYLTANSTLFVGPSVGDLHLLSSATAAINQAPPLSDVTTDIDGNIRPQDTGYDIGADEFVTAPIKSPPAAPTNLRVE
jgi:hypothetical protein